MKHTMPTNPAFSPEELWNKATKKIQEQIPFQSYNTWFRSSVGISLDNETLIVSVPNKFTADWLKNKFSKLVASAVLECLGSDRKIEYFIESKAEQAAAAITQYAAPEPIPAPPVKTDKEYFYETRLNTRYSFSNYVVGDSNQLSYAAARAVAEAPMQTKYNPLYVYGGSGLGKTHLVQAIGNYVVENFSTLRVLYVTSEKFTNDFIDAISNKKTSEFARLYRSVDLLLLEDIQFFTGKEATQEQFFHTFNTLHQAGKQIILTSDRPPREIKGLEERLLSRFQCGLVTDIQPPELETRIAILNQMVQSQELSISPDVILFIATNITKNIRELEGAIIRLLATGSLGGREINIGLAHDVLKDAFTNTNVITAEAITNTVCDYYRLLPDQLKSKRKTAEIVRARQAAMYLCRKHTSGSLKAIGDYYGGRDHSTVIHAITTVENGIELDFRLKNELDKIESLLVS